MKQKSRNKFLIVSALSLALAMSGVFAAMNTKSEVLAADADINVTALDVSMSDGAQAAYVKDEAQPANADLKYSGVKLTGGAGATFSLGTFKIGQTKSFWNGSEHDTENVKNGLYTGNDYQSFLSFVYSQQARGDKLLDISSLTVTLKSVDNIINYVSYNVVPYADGNELLIKSKSTNNNIYTCNRYETDGVGLKYNVRRQLNCNGAQPASVDLVWDNQKASAYTNIAYAQDVSSIKGAFCIRNYKMDAVSQIDGKDYYHATEGKPVYNENSFHAWEGFSDGEEVECTLTFESLQSDKETASIIVTSLCGNDLGDNFIVESGDIRLSGNNAATAKKGDSVTLKAPSKKYLCFGGAEADTQTDVYFAGKKIKTVIYGANGLSTEQFTFDRGGKYVLKHAVGENALELEEVITVSDTEEFSASAYAAKIVKTGDNAAAGFVASEKQAAIDKTYGGIKLTGSAGATFNLGSFVIDSDKFYWGSTERDVTNTENGFYTGERQGFLSFVYAPTYAKKEISELTVTLTNADNENEYVSFRISEHNKSGYLKIQAAATNNGVYACERFEKGGNTLGYNLPRDTMKWFGNQTVPVELIYDNAKASAYTNSTYSNTSSTAVGGVYVVRNFNSDVNRYCSKANDASASDDDVLQGSKFYTDNGFAPWAGFKEGTEVKCTVEFSSLSEENESSIIITSFAGEDLSRETLTVSHDNDALVVKGGDGEALDLNAVPEIPVDGSLVLPKIKRLNLFTGESDFNGVMLVAAPNNSIIYEETYLSGAKLNKDKLIENGSGEYKVIATDAYGNLKFRYSVNVYPVLSVEANNAEVKVDGETLENGKTVRADDEMKITVSVKKGYAITAITLDGAVQDTKEQFVLSAQNGFKNLKITVSAIIYDLKYAYFDGSQTGLNDRTFTVEDIANKTFELECPVKQGYTFGGWYLGSSKIESVSDLPLESVTLTGTFVKEHKKITCVIDGTETAVNSYGDDFSSYVPEKEGYVFDGWVDENGEKVNLSNLTSGAKIYAKFIKAEEIPTAGKETSGAIVNADIADGEIIGAYKIGVPEIIAFAVAGAGLGLIVFAVIVFFKNKAKPIRENDDEKV